MIQSAAADELELCPVKRDDDDALQESDRSRRSSEIEACDRHLADMIREHGPARAMVQPVSYGRFGPRLPGASFPQQVVLATLHGRW